MEVILTVYINYIHAITAITVRESRRMTISSTALTQMNSLKKKRSPQILKGNFLLKRDWCWAPGHGAPDRPLQGREHRGRRPGSPPSAGVPAPPSCRWSCARCRSARRTGRRCAAPARCFYPYRGSAGRGRGDASEDLHSVHVRRERPPASPGRPVNRLSIKATGSITVILLSNFLIIFLPLMCVWFHVLNMQLNGNKAIWKGMSKNQGQIYHEVK